MPGKIQEWLMVKAVFGGEEPGLYVEILAQVFADHGIGGVEISEPGATGLVDARDGSFSVTGYLPGGAERPARLAALERDIRDIALRLSFPCEIETAIRRDEEWAETWKRFFHPVRVSERLVVKPSWEPYDAGRGEIMIEIDPGMAFGTGGHATTSMCLVFLEKWMPEKARVLDVGTGSGILAIAAAKLGAAFVLGTDCDPDALETARENLEKNRIPAESYRLEVSDLTRGLPLRDFRLIVANIEAGPLILLLNDLRDRLSPGARLILSGILDEKLEGVLTAARRADLVLLDSASSAGWTALALERKSH